MLSIHFLIPVEDVIILSCYVQCGSWGVIPLFLFFQATTPQKQTCSPACPSFNLFPVGMNIFF